MSGGDDNPSAARGPGPSTPGSPRTHTTPHTSGPLAGDPALAGLNIRPGQRIRLLATWLWWRLDDRQRHGLGHTDLIRTLRLGLSAETLARSATLTRPGEALPDPDRDHHNSSGGAADPSNRGEPDTSAHRAGPGGPAATGRRADGENLLAALLIATGANSVPPPLRPAAALAARLPAAAVDRRLRRLVADLLGELLSPATGSALRLHTALRHLERTRDELVASATTGNPIAPALHGWMLAALTAAACAVAADPDRHRASGLVPPAAATHSHGAIPALVASASGAR
ncbi:hypothetical protein [Nocardia aurantia]|uniref:Uncharacterized protein n=1 Tax=Nocardia aurantia TaxID=2585199 RepID=A0A7K0DQW9_9NOCA|nr:hypothetical protein [Nocardia aurantia]MQY27927.1 hypothetical protein [Nocardia aurantia]